MQQLAVLYRSAQFYAHAAHNLTKGPTFFQDHGYLGSLYPIYEEAYDSLVERMLGLGEEVDPIKLTCDAAEMVKEIDLNSIFETVLEFERQFCKEIEAYSKEKISQGTLNLLADLADKSEARQYQIARRAS